MAQGKRSEEWGHTSSIIATIVNLVRDAKKRPKPYQPSEFNPTIATKKKKRDGWADVKAYYEHQRNQVG